MQLAEPLTELDLQRWSKACRLCPSRFDTSQKCRDGIRMKRISE